ncbi:aminotransferase class V-fold PLP-dependent enzyme [Virgibacillus sp. MSJ-26]|uniref:aminotransferase class V-fold PLP-dependent enzyme n=1 Tax=Virgibacillus sp. MSJ-26 TaxID=2841522 RepID=UPI001C11B0FB|nr:aminotransferase class V-fold PLP-dependent enzyme [Virgibacillus sp. MSJ-26]MBU5467474.1 aminotransferase class V-fold PLP-dependent enzyme [Virgibacillus sp. MSJ-26]
MIYFDQAASSFPKPPEVADAMVKAVNEVGANPGRGGHQLARQANYIINTAREKIAKWIGCNNPKQIVFFSNATQALNQAIKGLDWKEGDHVLTTSFEHNSVRRPLEFIKRTYDIHISYIDGKASEEMFISEVNNSITDKTKLMVMTHASNITGDILPLRKMINIAKRYGIITLVDASQTAGHLPINMGEQEMDMIVFPGHKGILGPQGTGVLAVRQQIDLVPLHHGGTGGGSELIDQPQQWPDRYESGTLNTPGIAGLSAAISVLEQSEKNNVPRETILTNELLKGLQSINGITCFGPSSSDNRLPIVAFNIKNIPSQEVAMILDSHYNIAVRAGLHCSPLTHETLQTMDQGIIRVSLSRYNTKEEVQSFLQAIEEIVTAYDEF